MYRSLFADDLFNQMERLQRQMQQAFDLASPSIRGGAGSFPALNIGHSPTSTEIYAFVPGIEPSRIDVTIDRGVLSISGERPSSVVPNTDSRQAVHGRERFAGKFRRVVSLPDDSDPAGVTATCRDGVLHVSVRRRESAQPRRIDVQ